MPSPTVFLCLFLLPFACRAAAPAASPVVACAIDSDDVIGDVARLRVGSSRDDVLVLLGEPDLRAGDGWWVYWNFRARPAEANPRGFGALVLGFSGDSVSGMKLADAREIRRCIERRKPRPLP
jgi:hypothetical protein